MRQQMRRRIGYLLEFLTGELRIFGTGALCGLMLCLILVRQWLYGTVLVMHITSVQGSVTTYILVDGGWILALFMVG